ncbi:MAG: hypothetical protein WC479_09955 [Candidatus Izemoplasmatales bacterium]|jgi:hypothetical protein
MKNTEIGLRFLKIESDIKLIKWIGGYLTVAITVHTGVEVFPTVMNFILSLFN